MIMHLNPCRYRPLRYASFLCIFVLLWVFLVMSRPRYARILCPVVTELPFPHSVSTVCTRLLAGDFRAVDDMIDKKWCQRRKSIPDNVYTALASNCSSFRTLRGYCTSSDSTADERAFPLAFSILMHESVEQTERLLRAIYRPHNFYCLHVDAKASHSVLRAVDAVVSCLPNVIMPASIKVDWSELSVLQAELLCMRELLSYAGWKYFINLTGRDFPLKTNSELVAILKSYNGANDIDGSPHKRPQIWTKYVWRNENWRTNIEKPPTPHGFLISKGSTHIAASRAFIEFTILNQKARDLFDWMRDIRVPDEHYFATLNHNPQLGVPGAYKGDPDLKWSYTRLKIWQSKDEMCAGRWFRFICQLGSGDLWRLPKAPHLFVNKLHIEMDPMAFECVEQWLQNKTHSKQVIDVNFYKNLDFVRNHA